MNARFLLSLGLAALTIGAEGCGRTGNGTSDRQSHEAEPVVAADRRGSAEGRGRPSRQAESSPASQGSAGPVVRFDYRLQLCPPYRIDSVAADGSVQISPYWQMWTRAPRELDSQGVAPELLYALAIKAKGRSFLGFTGFPPSELEQVRSYGVVAKPVEDIRIVRVQVVDVVAGGNAVIRVGPQAAAQLKAGDQLFLVLAIAETQVQAIPDIIPLVDGRQGTEAAAWRAAGLFSQSQQNLLKIGQSLLKYREVFHHFPRAVVYGPDDKPWHSWRVLILPYLGQATLYDRYRFDEPWDGLNNKQLLDSMPDVYRDPVYDESSTPHTCYAAITGPGTAFPLEPRERADYVSKGRGLSAASTRRSDMTDSAAQTVLLASVSPDRKISWTQPEDVLWNDKPPGIGDPGGIAPHRFGEHTVGVFLWADGGVSCLRDDLDLKTLRSVVQIADGGPRDPFPDFGVRQLPPGFRYEPVLEIPAAQPGASARLLIRPPDGAAP